MNTIYKIILILVGTTLAFNIPLSDEDFFDLAFITKPIIHKVNNLSSQSPFMNDEP